MYKITKSFKISGSITTLDRSDEFVIIIDNTYTLYFLDADTFNIVDTKKLAPKHKEWHLYYNGNSLHHTQMLCIPFRDTKKFYILQYSQKEVKKLAESSWFSSDIEASAFCPKNGIVAVGGMDGRCAVFTPKGAPILCLERRPEYVSLLRFSHNGEYFVSCAYDGTLWIYGMDACDFILQCTLDGDIVEAVSFYDNDRFLYAATRNGWSLIIDLMKKSIVSQKQLFDQWVSCVEFSANEAICFVGTRSDQLFLVDIATHRVVASLKVHVTGIVDLKRIDNHLMLGGYDGTVTFFDMMSFSEEFEIAIKLKEWNTAKSLMESNTFLWAHTPRFKFDEAWEGVLQNAIKLLATVQVEKALELVHPFLDNPERSEEFKFYLSQNNEIISFFDAVENKKIAQAYELANEKKFLQKTIYYEQLESTWNKTFLQARKILAEDPVYGKTKAQELLKAYMRINTKREIIVTLFNKAHLFKEAEDMIKGQEFTRYFMLVENCPFLKDTPLYARVLLLGKNMEEKMLLLERQKQFVEAIKVAQLLAKFTPYNERALKFVGFMRLLNAFLLLIKQNRTVAIYESVAKNENLSGVAEFVTFRQIFEKGLHHDALNLATAGRIDELETTLSPYEEIPQFKEKVRSLYKTATINILLNETMCKTLNLDKSIGRYLAVFGNDSHIEKIVTLYKKESLLTAPKQKFSNVDHKSVIAWE